MQTPEPSFWLMFEPDDGGDPIAVAGTDLVATDRGDSDVGLLTAVACGFHEAHPDQRFVFVSDLSRWLSLVGLDWERLDLDVDTLASALIPSGMSSGSPTSRAATTTHL